MNPLDLAQWRFFVISTERLSAELGAQKSVGLGRLRQIGTEETSYSGLAAAIEEVACPSAAKADATPHCCLSAATGHAGERFLSCHQKHKKADGPLP